MAYLIQTLFYADDGRNDWVWALSFLAGVVPTTVLQQLGTLVSATGDQLSRSVGFTRHAFEGVFATPRALTLLDGVDLHDSTRLETEGISDIPSLASADLVSLMVSTRVPVDRLVDWVDQAVLLLLVPDPAADQADRAAPRVTQLRSIGVRTASDVLAVAHGDDQRMQDAVGAVIAVDVDGAPGVPSLDALAAAILRQPVMASIEQWRASKLADVSRRWSNITVPHGESFLRPRAA